MGRYETTTVAGEEVSAFVHFVQCSLPPTAPPLALDAETRAMHQRAERALARLELASEMVPSVSRFIYAFVRKEAVESSQIEGIQCTLIDLDTTKPTATKAVTALADAGVLIETTGRKRDRAFSYNAYLDLLRTGTELEHERRR